MRSCRNACLVLLLQHATLHTEALQTANIVKGADGAFRKVNHPVFDVTALLRDGLTPPVRSNASNATDEADPVAALDYVRINGEGDSLSLKKSLVVSTALALGLLASFSLLRYISPSVYTRAESTDLVPLATAKQAKDVRGILDWLLWVWRTTPEEEVEAAGLDGWSVLAFYRLSTQLFAFLGLIIMSVFLPLHWAYTTDQSMDPLTRLDIGGIPSGSPVFWVHAVGVWFVVLFSTSAVLQAHKEFIDRRFDWLKEIPEPRASTLMVENIPPNYRSDQALMDYFVEVFKEDAVESAYIVRKTPKLRTQLSWLARVKYQLMIEQSRWEQMGSDEKNREKVEHYERLREEALKAVAEELEQVEDAVTAQDSSVVSQSGFVTFTSEFWQRLASKEQYRADVTEFVVSMPPEAEDVQWQDLSQGQLHSSMWEALGWLSLVLIFLFWSPIVAAISTMTTLQNVGRIVPSVLKLCEKRPSLQLLIEGFLATAALRLFLSFLPNILMVIIRRFFTLKAGTLAQLRLQRWYYSFLLLFVLLITIVGRSALLTAASLIQNPGSLVNRLSASLPSASHFYLSYMVLGWFTAAFEMLRLTNFLKYAYLRLAYRLDIASAKEYSEPEDEDAYGVGSRMGMAVLMASITIVFCSCTPLILVLATVYFFIGRLVYGYLLVHAESKKPDLGGNVFHESLRQILFALAIYVLEMTGVLLRRTQQVTSASTVWTSPHAPAVVAGSSILALVWAWRRLHSFGWESLPLEEVVRASRERARRATEAMPQLQRRGRYVQRECDLELLLEDAEKVARTRAAAQGSSLLGSVHDYVHSTADLVNFATSMVTTKGTDVAAAALDRGMGAVDQTVWGFVHYGTTGAQASVEAATSLVQKVARGLVRERTTSFSRALALRTSSRFSRGGQSSASGLGEPPSLPTAHSSPSAAAEPGTEEEAPEQDQVDQGEEQTRAASGRRWTFFSWRRST